MLRILHVSAHYGGGVGTVLKAWAAHDQENVHQFTYLNPGNPGTAFDIKYVIDADVVVAHVWNHPAMFEFLLNTPLPPCRLVLWSHVSGLYPPYVHFTRLIEHADRFVFTSPVSYESPEIQRLPEALKSRLSTIWSTYGLEEYADARPEPHEGFNIGLVGTVDYGKLHPSYIDICSRINAPGVRFVVCSRDSQDRLKADAVRAGVVDRFIFEGAVPSVKPYLCAFDVFGYPLQPTHFGSCEQALGEAMVCGAVPVVLNNPSERYIVEHMKTGIVAANTDDYVAAVEYLYANKEARRAMSANAQQAARKRYDIRNTISRWQRVFEDVMRQDRRAHEWASGRAEPHVVYATAMGLHGKPFMDYVFADYVGDAKLRRLSTEEIRDLYGTNSMFASARKGSVRQYLAYYPENKYLQEWTRLV